MADSRRTVVIGLDGADFRYLDRFSGDLPALTALRSRGAEAPLRSTHPPWTASAWPSAYTGVAPADHGVHGFFTYEGHDPRRSRLIDRSDVAAPALWNYLSAAGVPSVVCNVPVTHPADPLEGALVPGYFAPPGADGHPPGIRAQLSDAVGDYRIYPGDAATFDGNVDADAFVASVENRTDAALELLETVEWRLAFLQVQATDTAAHDLDVAALRRVYAAADRFVASVLEAVPEGTAVVVCSDHGMGPAEGGTVFVNEVLRDRGLLAGSGRPRPGEASPGLGRLVGAAGARGVRTALDALGVTGKRVPRSVKRVGDAVLGTGSDARSAVEGVDWKRSRAFCRVGSEMGVRVNLAGREPDGRVSRAEYETVRDRVLGALRAVETPAGDSPFAVVDRYEAVTGASPTGDPPDVAFRPAAQHSASAKLAGRRLATNDPGRLDHRPEGVFVAADGPFADADPVEGISITDVAPIAMASLGLAVPERMTGSVPSALVDPTGRRRYADLDRGVDVGGGTDRSGASAVRDRLDDLGYL